MYQINNKLILNLILTFSIFALGAAYFIEYVLNHKPCNLCLIERLPYLFAILVVIANLTLKNYEKIFLFILSLIFLFGAMVSFYHFGIEQGFFEETLVCNLNSESTDLSKENILKDLKQSNISCKDVSFRILGLSLATINTIVSLILSFITFRLYLNHEKK